VVEQLASSPSTDAARVEQLLRAMRSIAEIADAALRDDHRLLYFSQLARQAEAAFAPPKSGEHRTAAEPRNIAEHQPAKVAPAS
jgi:hypothetical protein